MLFPLYELIADRKLTTIDQDSKLSDALRIMIEQDFSYLPVVDAGQKLVGVVSEQTIVRKYFHFNGDNILFQSRVKDCCLRGATLAPTADIFDALRVMETAGAVIVAEGAIPVGIVTDYDTTQFFRKYSQGIILCQDIEFNLRNRIAAIFPPDSPELLAALITAFGPARDKRLVGRPEKEYDDLSLWDHVQLLLTDANWGKLNGSLEPKALFRRLMEPVRIARNQIAHFRGDLTPVQLDALAHARFWLETREIASLPDPSLPPVVDVTVAATSVEGATPIGIEVLNETPNVSTNAGTTQDAPLDGSAKTAEGTAESDNLEKDGEPTGESERPDEQPIFAEKPSEVSIDDATLKSGKYSPLYKWLRNQADDLTHIRVSFNDIERILKASLPTSAREHPSWWANDSTSHRQSQAWLQAGWRVETADVQEGRVIFRRVNSLVQQEFFRDVLERLKQERPDATRAQRIQPQNWFSFGAGRSGVIFAWSFGYEALRVEVYIDTGSFDTNKLYFDTLYQQREAIERAIGTTLTWSRLENRRASRISAEHPGKITDPPEVVEALKDWALATMIKFVDAFREPIRALP